MGVRLHLGQVTDIYANDYTTTNVGLEGGLDRAMAFVGRQIATWEPTLPTTCESSRTFPKLNAVMGDDMNFIVSPKASVIISRGPGVWYWVCEGLLVLLGGCLEACLEVCLVTGPLDAARVIGMA